MSMSEPRTGSAALGIFVIIIAALALVAFFSVRIVGVGQAGVVHTFGVVDPNPRPSGLIFKVPWASLEQMNVRTQEFTMSSRAEDAGRGSDDAVQTLTKEGLTVGLDITVLYRLNFDQSANIFRTVGENYQGVIVRPAIRNAIRDVVAQYTASALYTEGRELVAIQIEEQLGQAVQARGIMIEDVLLRDVRLPTVIQSAIENKLAAEQAIQEREFKVAEAEQEAKRRVEEATGQRDAQKLINETLSPEYLQFLYIESLKAQKDGNVIYVPVSPNTGLPVYVNVGSETPSS